MTDYLELAVREDVDALREAERRLALLRMPFLTEKPEERGRPGKPEEQDRPEERKRPERPGDLKRAGKTGEGRRSAGPSPAKSSVSALAERQAALDSEEGEIPASAGALLLEQLWRWEAPARRDRETAPDSGSFPDLSPASFPGGDREDPWSAFTVWDREDPQSALPIWDREDPKSAFAAWNREDPWSAFAAWGREDPEEGQPSLLDQLEQAERAVAAGRTLAGPATGGSGSEESTGSQGLRPPERGIPSQPDYGDGGWAVPPGGESARQEGEDLARQIDRAFQRDARRYDGGFFLY